MHTRIIALIGAVPLFIISQPAPRAALGAGEGGTTPDVVTRMQETADTVPPERLILSDAAWARRLTKGQFLVTRRKQTELAFTGKYVHNHARGTYLCVCCGLDLFDSRAKFESGTGWPSFWRPITPAHLASAPDYDMGVPRVEVKCHRCDAHLGHVFSDGPPPTGLRFCINSASLKFVPDRPAVSKAKSKAKAPAAASAETPSDAPPADGSSGEPTPGGEDQSGAQKPSGND